MADKKVSQLTALTGANTASGDLLYIVDVSEPLPADQSKKITLTEFQSAPISAGTANGLLYLNASKVPTSGVGLTYDGTDLTVVGAVNAGSVNTTTLDLTNLEVTNIKAKDGTAAATIADATGKITVSTELAVDNLNLSGNTLASTDTNGDIVIAPNGTGDVQLDADTVRVGDANSNALITTNGTGDLVLNTNSGTNSGFITIEDGVNGNIIIAPNGTGQVQITNAALDLTTIEVTNIKAKDGTAAMTLADSTGVTTFAANPILDAGTANGVLYLNASKVATSGSALTFDGTSLGIGVAPSAKLDVSGASGGIVYVRGTGDAYQEIAGGSRTPGTGSLLVGQGNAGEGYLWNRFNSYLAFGLNNAEAMRLTSKAFMVGYTDDSGFSGQYNAAFSGNVGIGTSSPAYKLDVRVAPASGGAAGAGVTTGSYEGTILITGSAYNNYGVGANTAWLYSATNDVAIGPYGGSGTVQIVTGGARRATFDSSGNLTLNSATANGVGYFNGSKVLTSGTALTFDGTNFGLNNDGYLIFASPDATVEEKSRIQWLIEDASEMNSIRVNRTNAFGESTMGFYTRGGGPSALRYLIGTDGTSIWSVAGSEQMRVTSTGLEVQKGAVFNESGADSDFRVESDTNTHAFFLDAAVSRFGFNSASTPTTVSLAGATGVDFGFSLSPSGWNDALHRLTVPVSGDTSVWSFNYSGSAVDFSGYATSSIQVGQGAIIFGTGAVNTAPSEKFKVALSEAVFNEGGLDYDFRVESDTSTHAFFVDAGGNTVNINSSTNFAGSRLFVNGAITTGYADTIGMRYNVSGSTNAYYKGMTGTNPSAAVARGLHLFNYDQDSDPGIQFWSGVPGGTVYSMAIFGPGTTGEVAFNEDGLDRDFRVESDTNTHALFVDASANAVGILFSTPVVPLQIGSFGSASGMNETQLALTGASGFNAAAMVFNSSNTNYAAQFYFDPATGNINYRTTTNASTVTTHHVFAVGGAVTFNESGADADFRVESDTNANRLFIDASADVVFMGTTTNTNSSKLVVDGSISETVGGVQYQVVSQADIGTAPNEIPLNQYLGTMAYQDGTNYFNTGMTVGFRNRIINGAMLVDQRNAGASVAVSTTTATYLVDRWQAYISSGTCTFQQVSDAPANFTTSLRATTTSASSGATWLVQQFIEGLNCADLAFGLSTAKTVTLSFWVKSSVAGTYAGSLENSALNRSFVFTYTVNTTGTWEYKTITISGDTSGTWLTSNGTGVKVAFSFGTGGTGTTSGVWTAGDFIRTSSAVGIEGTASATWQVTGVQFEVGTQATPFDWRPYTTEYQLCQRYFEKSIADGTAATATANPAPTLVAAAFSTTAARTQVFYKTPKRATPTLTTIPSSTVGTGNQWGWFNGAWNGGATTVAQQNANAFSIDIAGTYTQFYSYIIDGNWYASAEL